MKNLISLLLALALGAMAHAAPSKESMTELLKLVNGQGVLDMMAQKLDAKMEEQFDNALTNRETPEGLAYAESFRKKVQERFVDKITLPQLAGECLIESGEDLTQAEVDALIAFCATTAGRSALIKLSPLMRNFEALAQKRVIQFRMAPEQSMLTAMQELKEITFKALGIKAPANQTKAAPVTQPAAAPAGSAHP